MIYRLQLNNSSLIVGNIPNPSLIYDIGNQDTNFTNSTLGSTVEEVKEGKNIPYQGVGSGGVMNEICSTNQVKIRVVTFNMYGQQPPPIHVLRERLIPKKKVNSI